MKIIVLSCSQNWVLWEPFHHCLEKYWPNHPEVIYYTDGDINPYYRTIPVDHDLNHWTTGLRIFLDCIVTEQVLLMIDDCFIRKPVDDKRVEYASLILYGEKNLACMNFELSWDTRDEPTIYEGWKKRKHGSAYEVSLMCGLWNKAKLMDVISRDCDPWTIELDQDNRGYDYYINSGWYIIDWGYRTFQPCGVVKGSWSAECIHFLESEGLNVPYELLGKNKNVI